MPSLLVYAKLILRKFILIDSFCKECGRKDEGFYVPDIDWKKVKPFIKLGNVLCLDCFWNICAKHKIEPKFIRHKNDMWE